MLSGLNDGRVKIESFCDKPGDCVLAGRQIWRACQRASGQGRRGCGIALTRRKVRREAPGIVVVSTYDGKKVIIKQPAHCGIALACRKICAANASMFADQVV